ncbi:MAG: putative basic amino acid antiporter YfcC [Spirochaetes bacterium]|nr:putative basic amino acid antiporter YfcC [Spirochaetota bacterium]
MSSPNNFSNTQNKVVKVPHTYVIIFFVVVFAWLLTLILPVGKFEKTEVKYLVNGKEKTRMVVKPGSFQYLKDENGNLVRKPTRIWGTEDFGGYGLLNYVFEGMVRGDKWGAAVGIIAFILVIGGAFGIILRTGAIDAGILRMINITKGKEVLIIPVLFVLFSLGGAVFGMGEETIPFAMIVVPLVVAMGYDAIVGVLITYVASQIGFATSWMNPFSLAVAQGVSGIPVFSGAPFRIIMWFVFTLIGTLYTIFYARKVKKDLNSSIDLEATMFFKNNLHTDFKKTEFNIGHKLVILTVFLGVIWVIWGVIKKGYYIPEIASQFFVMGLVAGIISVIFKLEGMKIDDIASSFQKGASDLVGAALVVGMAQGILIVLGGTDAATPTVLNTILNSLANGIGKLGGAFSAWFMYLFQSIFNFFVVSGSGQASITMPIMAPLSDLVGVTRQVAVLAFQLGDGLTNIIVPTSACLMGVLGVARINWGKWAKWQIKMQLFLFLIGTIFVLVGHFIGYK